jgi:hypothetical protein
MAINVLSDLALNGSLIVTNNNNTFPDNPQVGTMLLKENVLYAYITVGGLTTWYPFSHKTNSYIHTQGADSSSWLINHGLGTNDVWYQVQDIYGSIIMSSGVTRVDTNSFYINFASATRGVVLVVGPDTVSAPSVETTSINVDNGAVIIDGTGVKVNGEYITSGGGSSADIGPEQTARIAADATLQANINAEITARSNADTTLQSNVDAEITARTNADTTLQSSISTLQSSLDAEITARTNADTTLQASLTGGTSIVSMGSSTINCSSGTFFQYTVTTNTLIGFSNVPANVAYLATVKITHNSGTISWPNTVKWPSSSDPSLSTGKIHIFNFLTDDGGTTWRGSALVDYT